MESALELEAYLQRGDLRGAGTWLVNQHAHEVVGLCRAMVRDASAAEDLAQEVFGRAFSSLGHFRGEASPRTWILAIARNRCIDHLRALRRNPWRGASEQEQDPDSQPDDQPLAPDLLARQAEVAEALSQLSEGERALVILRFRHGLSYRELAGVFGLKEGTVRMRLSRALARMRQALQPLPLAEAALSAAELGDEEQAPAEPEIADLDRLGDLDELAAPAQAAPPPSAPARASSQPLQARRRSLFGRLLGRRSASEDAAPPAPAAPHPLAAVLGQLDPGLSASLRDRLLAQTQQL